jgi:hypothetical protein
MSKPLALPVALALATGSVVFMAIAAVLFGRFARAEIRGDRLASRERL